MSVALLKFSASLLSGGGALTTWVLSDRGTYTVDVGLAAASPVRYPLPAGTAKRLRVRIAGNTFTGAATARIMVNNIPTSIVLVIPPATSGDFSDLVNFQVFAAGQQADLLITVPNGTVGGARIWATLEYA